MRKSIGAFATIVAFVLTGYLALATAILDDGASSDADHAVVNLLTVLMGGAGILALSLLIRVLSQRDGREAAPERTES